MDNKIKGSGIEEQSLSNKLKKMRWKKVLLKLININSHGSDKVTSWIKNTEWQQTTNFYTKRYDVHPSHFLMTVPPPRLGLWACMLRRIANCLWVANRTAVVDDFRLYLASVIFHWDGHTGTSLCPPWPSCCIILTEYHKRSHVYSSFYTLRSSICLASYPLENITHHAKVSYSEETSLWRLMSLF